MDINTVEAAELPVHLLLIKSACFHSHFLHQPMRLLFLLSAYENNEIVVSYEKRLSTVRQAEETNRQLMTSLSLDVRTPLTTLIGYLDAAHRGIVTGKDKDDYIETARRKAHDLIGIFLFCLHDCGKLHSE